MTQSTPPSAWWASAARHLLTLVFLFATFGKLTSPAQFLSFLALLGFCIGLDTGR